MGAERTQHVGPVRHGDLQGNKQSLGCSDRKLLRASCRVLFFPLLSYDKALTVHFFQVPKQEDAACLVRTQDATLARVLPSGRYRPERHVRLSQRGRRNVGVRTSKSPRLGSAAARVRCAFQRAKACLGNGSIEESSSAVCLGNHR